MINAEKIFYYSVPLLFIGGARGGHKVTNDHPLYFPPIRRENLFYFTTAIFIITLVSSLLDVALISAKYTPL